MAQADLRRALWHVTEGERLSKTGSFTADLQLERISWSDELFRICEVDPQTRPAVEVVRDRVHPDDMALFDAEIQRALGEGVSDFNFRMRMPDGGEKYLRAAARVIEGPILMGIVQDITESKLAERELRRSAAALVEGQHLSKTGSYLLLPVEDELVVSEELRVIFGYGPDETATLPDIWERMLPEYREPLGVQLQSALDGNRTASLFQMRMPDGEIKTLRSITDGARMQDGRLEMIGSVQDITESKLAEEALTRARGELARVARVVTLNAMTASIAHEVAQPLSGILTNANTCARMLAADPPNLAGAAETAQRTIRDANRASEVIRRLRAMFSTKAPTIEAADFNDVAREVITLSAFELQRRGALLQTAFADDLPRVRVDRVQLQQVILNLLLNAADAMAEVDDRPRTLQVATGLREDGAVMLAVRDSGTGFDPQSVEKLFEAFYTTKPDGMGVGLSICRSIVEKHNGRLWAEANEGPGATFSFYIPVAAEPFGAPIPSAV
jgi:PAS domain S-box-containing protein